MLHCQRMFKIAQIKTPLLSLFLIYAKDANVIAVMTISQKRLNTSAHIDFNQ